MPGSYYQKTIRGLDPTLNPAGVEAAMRLHFGVLDHLPLEVFASEIQIARACEQEEPGFLRGCAYSMGHGADFEAWEGEG